MVIVVNLFVGQGLGRDNHGEYDPVKVNVSDLLSTHR